jgi:hypothetical protein
VALVIDRALSASSLSGVARESGVSETCCKNWPKEQCFLAPGIAGVQGRFKTVQVSIREWKGVLNATLAQNPLDRSRAGCFGDHRGPRRRVWRRRWRRLLVGNARTGGATFWFRGPLPLAGTVRPGAGSTTSCLRRRWRGTARRGPRPDGVRMAGRRDLPRFNTRMPKLPALIR